MRYRKLDCYPAQGGVVVNVIWQDDSKIFNLKEIRLALKYSGYKKVSEGIICKPWDDDKSTPYGFYFIPETHPLFNCSKMSGLKNEFWTHPFKGIDAPSIGFSIEKMVGKYVRRLFK